MIDIKLIARRLFTVIFIAAGLLSLCQHILGSINFDDQKPLIIDALKKNTGLDVKISGAVRLSLFPLAIKVKQFSISDDTQTIASADKLMLHTGLLQIFNEFNFDDISKLTIQRGVINATLLKESLQNNRGLKNLPIKTLVLQQCSFIDSTAIEANPRFKIINAEITYQDLISNKFAISANFIFDEQPFLLVGDFQNITASGHSDHAILKVDNESISFSFSGSLDDFFQSPKLVGSIALQLRKWKTPVNSNQYINNDLLQSLIKNNNITFSADLEAREDMVNINNLKVNSQDIQNLSGSINFDIEGQDLDAEIHIDTINADRILDDYQKYTQYQQSRGIRGMGYLLAYMIEHFNMHVSKELFAEIKLDIRNLIINNDRISDITSSIDFLRGLVLISSLNITTPGAGKINFEGVIEQNEVRPRLLGVVVAQVADFKQLSAWSGLIDDDSALSLKNLLIKADIELMPRYFAVHNIRAALDGMQFVGQSNTHISSDNNMHFEFLLRFSKLDTDLMNLQGMMNSALYNLFISDFDKTGATFSAFTKDFIWLKKFNHTLNADINIDNLTFRGQKLSNASINFALSNGKIGIGQLSWDSEAFGLKSSMQLTVPKLRPYITGQLTFSNLNYDKVQALLPNFNDFQSGYRNYLQQKFNQSSPQDEEEKAQREQQMQASSYTVNFLGIGNYDVDLDLFVKSFADPKLESLKCHLQAGNGLLNLNEVLLKAYGGTINFNANVSTMTFTPSYGISFSTNSVDPSVVYEWITGMPKNLHGYFGTAGSISARGGSLPEILKSLGGNIEVSGRQLDWPGFNLKKIIDTTESNLAIDDKMKNIQYYSNDGSTLFDEVKGSINLNNGMATLDGFVLKNLRTSGAFAARYSMPSRAYNAVAKYAFIPIGKSKPITLTLSSKGLISQPNTTFDFDSFKADLIAILPPTVAQEPQQETQQPLDAINAILLSRRGG